MDTTTNFLPLARQEVFARLVASGTSKVDAYQQTHPNCNPQTAKIEGCRDSKKPHIRDRIQQLIESSSKLNPEGMAKKMEQWIDAKKPIIQDGQVVGTYEDTTNQIECGKMVLKAYGLDGETNDTTSININVADIPTIQNIANTLQSLNKALGCDPLQSGDVVIDAETS